MPYKTLFGTAIAKEIADAPPELVQQVIAKYTAWYYAQGQGCKAEEKAECRKALGIDQSLEETPFHELVPDGWFLDVLRLVKQSESPASFFFLASVAVFTQLIGRRVVLNRGTHRLGMDTSVMLISPAGRGRRSTACDFVVYELGEPAGLSIIADSFTYEAFGEGLVMTAEKKPSKHDRRAYNAKALVYAGEMSVLLGKGSYGESIIAKLTDILGKTSRFNWQTVKRGKIEFVNPCVNAIFTSSPDWLADNIPAIVFGGGMMSRELVSVQERPERIVTWADPIPVEDKALVVEQLQNKTRLQGEFARPEGEVFEWYNDWYQKHSRKSISGELPDDRMGPYMSRKHDHLLRLAAALTLASPEPSLELSVKKLEQALKILDKLELDIPKAYAAMAVSPLAAVQRTITQVLIQASGQMDKNRLHKKVYRTLPLVDQFNAVLASMIEMGVVQKLPAMHGKGHLIRLLRALD